MSYILGDFFPIRKLKTVVYSIDPAAFLQYSLFDSYSCTKKKYTLVAVVLAKVDTSRSVLDVFGRLMTSLFPARSVFGECDESFAFKYGNI